MGAIISERGEVSVQSLEGLSLGLKVFASAVECFQVDLD